jgi:UDP-N-acetyl-D-glucosamine dehydrogenase
MSFVLPEQGMRRLLVVGQGYVGLPLAMRAVAAGHRVTGFDTDQSRVDRLRKAQSFVEDVDDRVLQSALDSGRFSITAEFEKVEEFDVAVVTVPTPLKENVPDLSFVESAAEQISRLVTRGCTVVLESTTYPGTTRDLFVPILQKGSGLIAGEDFYVGFSPERIDPGNKTWTFTSTPKLVSGINPESLRAVASFYSDLVDTVIPVANCEEAELSKLLENTFRHVNIALINELAQFANALGIDIWKTIDAASTKPFGYMRFVPGPGVGGHCLPIDPSYLSWRVSNTLGVPFRFVDLANNVNNRMPEYVVERISLILNRMERSINCSNILLLGLAYKRNSSDARESPAVDVARSLLRRGANITAVEPYLSAVPEGMKLLLRGELTERDIESSDLVVVLTDHDQFDYGKILAKAKVVFDTRNRMPDGANVERL